MPPTVAHPSSCVRKLCGSAQGFWDFLQDRRRVSGTIRASRAEQHPLAHLQLAHFTWNPTPPILARAIVCSLHFPAFAMPKVPCMIAILAATPTRLRAPAPLPPLCSHTAYLCALSPLNAPRSGPHGRRQRPPAYDPPLPLPRIHPVALRGTACAARPPSPAPGDDAPGLHALPPHATPALPQPSRRPTR